MLTCSVSVLLCCLSQGTVLFVGSVVLFKLASELKVKAIKSFQLTKRAHILFLFVIHPVY